MGNRDGWVGERKREREGERGRAEEQGLMDRWEKERGKMGKRGRGREAEKLRTEMDGWMDGWGGIQLDSKLFDNFYMYKQIHSYTEKLYHRTLKHTPLSYIST